MRFLVPLAIGLLFGAGLTFSGMIYPNKVLGFLDLAGAWDPSLAFVMMGAISVGPIAFRLARTRNGFAAPDTTIDAKLILGSALFGVGWGLVGFCPGPALADLGFLEPKVWGFVLAMAAGMALHSLYERVTGQVRSARQDG